MQGGTAVRERRLVLGSLAFVGLKAFVLCVLVANEADPLSQRTRMVRRPGRGRGFGVGGWTGVCGAGGQCGQDWQNMCRTRGRGGYVQKADRGARECAENVSRCADYVLGADSTTRVMTSIRAGVYGWVTRPARESAFAASAACAVRWVAGDVWQARRLSLRIGGPKGVRYQGAALALWVRYGRGLGRQGWVGLQRRGTKSAGGAPLVRCGGRRRGAVEARGGEENAAK